MTEPQSVTRNGQFVADLRSSIPTDRWSTWFSGVRLSLTDRSLEVAAPSDFHMHWLQNHYRDLIESLAGAHLGTGVEVRYIVDRPARPELPGDPVRADAPAAARTGTGRVAADTTAGTVNSPAPDPQFSRKYVFDTFVVGESNRLAQAACQSVAERPGQQYNPLFIYGGAGLGKTHLLHAIAHHTRIHHPSGSVRYLNSETFFNEFVDAIRRKRMNEFKCRHRTIDLLLLDDVQFFEGKEQVLEEVFHTFNTLHERKHQMVLTCDRPPKDLGIEERLCSRFQWGLQVDIGPPTLETRLAILKRNAAYAPASVPEAVIEFIAQHITHNIRELEGALTRVTAYAALTEQPITMDLAKEQLRDLIPTGTGRPPTGQEILTLAAVSHGFSVADLQGPSRKSPVVQARHIAMYLCRNLTDLSLPKTGKLFGGRDHSTVSHAVDKISRLIESDPRMANRISVLSEKLCAK